MQDPGFRKIIVTLHSTIAYIHTTQKEGNRNLLGRRNALIWKETRSSRDWG
uniref:Uncharacterized protein n=1 Tax=Arundo donax TaxID=35708 RepID=A0A0A9DU36_ARUDO